MDPIANPSIWAEVGGLNGLVIFALFGTLYAFAKTLQTILDNHREDLSKLMALHAKEREEWGRIVDSRQQETNARQQETNAAIKGFTAALIKLSGKRYEGDDQP
jgi:uncharacterized protein YbgA (DUF1722 family)